MTKKYFILLLLLCQQTLFAQRRVIFLIADDLGTDYFGFYPDGQDTVDVPNIRSLLSKGVKFTNAMANPVCSSTRASLLTGRYGFRTGVGYIVGNPQGSGQLDTTEISIPRLLKIHDANIKAANIGKWHLHQPTPAGNLMFPQVLGYDHFEGPFIGAINSYTNWTKYTNGVMSTVTQYATSETIDNAVSWIKSINHPSYFLWMAFVAPHSPYHLPPANLHSYNNLSGTTQDITQNPKAYFKASLQALDTEIGRLFDSLQVLNQLDSTTFIFMGDNGNTTQTAQIANALKAKGTVYQYGVHVPLIIAGPDIVNPGRTSNALVNSVDIFATIQGLFGNINWQQELPPGIDIDSRSLMPILKNQVDSIRPWAFTEQFKIVPDTTEAKAIRNKEYKLIRYNHGREEFYHLPSDSLELNNLLSNGLDAVELVHYHYLCNELENLTLMGLNCTSTASLSNQALNGRVPLALPNPFYDKISLKNYENERVYLYHSSGSLIYSGNEIESQNFSELPEGLYFLRFDSSEGSGIKLIKSSAKD